MPSDRRSPAHGNAGRRSGSGQRGAGLERRELSGVWRRVLTLLSSGGVGSLPSPSGRFLMLKSKLGTPGSHLGTPGMAPDQTFSLITSRSIIPVSKRSFPRLKRFQLCCWLGESPPDPSAVPSAGPPANTLVPGAGWGPRGLSHRCCLTVPSSCCRTCSTFEMQSNSETESGASVDGGLYASLYL